MQYSFKKLNLIVGWLSFVLASTVYLLTMEPTADTVVFIIFPAPFPSRLIPHLIA